MQLSSEKSSSFYHNSYINTISPAFYLSELLMFSEKNTNGKPGLHCCIIVIRTLLLYQVS